MTIGRKMGVMILATVLLMATGMGIIIYSYTELLRTNTQLLTEKLNSLLMLKSAELELKNYKLTQKYDHLKELQNIINKFADETKNRLDHARTTGNLELINILGENKSKVDEIISKVNKAMKGEKEKEIIYMDLMYAMPYFVKGVEKFSEMEEKRFSKRRASIEITTLAFAIGIVIITIILSLNISYRIVSSIKRLIISIDIASKEGYLTQSLFVKSKDEMGRLAEVFNTLISNLNGIVKRIRAAAEKTSTSIQEFSSSSSELKSASQHIAQTSHDIARGAMLQVRQVEKASQVIEQMLTSVARVASRSQITAEKTTVASNIAQRGSEATKEAITKMQQINETVSKSALAAKKWDERSKQIGQIVDVITKIAEQTNLLALNTSIEAARSGEAASGFAVIAEEVRKLAEWTAKSAEQITRLIKDIQTNTTQVVISMEAGRKEVSEGMEVVNKSGIALDEVLKVMWEVAALAQEISKSTQEQVVSCEQVRNSFAAIATVADEKAQSTEEARTKAEEQTELAERIALYSQGLSKISNELVEAVQKFKV